MVPSTLQDATLVPLHHSPAASCPTASHGMGCGVWGDCPLAQLITILAQGLGDRGHCSPWLLIYHSKAGIIWAKLMQKGLFWGEKKTLYLTASLTMKILHHSLASGSFGVLGAPSIAFSYRGNAVLGQTGGGLSSSPRRGSRMQAKPHMCPLGPR